MGSLSRMLWGALIVFNIKMIAWMLRELFNLIKLIFGGLFYLIGWIWSSIFSREKKPKQEIHERVETENLVQCADCGTMEPSSLMTVCPDCGSYLCSDCRKHHNCVVEAESCSYEEEISHAEENHGDYGDGDEHLINYGDVQYVHKPQPVKKKSTGEVSSKGVKIALAVILFILLFMITGFIPVAISFPILAGIGIYIIYLCINPQRENTCSKNEQLITCTECGIQEPISLMTTCPVCGAILCSSCKKHHGCISELEPLMEQSNMNGVEEPIVNSSNQELITCMGCGKQHQKSAMKKCHTCGAVLCPSCRKHHVCGEEMVECMGCGEWYPKSAMRKCHTCGDVLCPSCRKHHVCTEKKGSLDRFLESEPSKPSDITHVEKNPTDTHAAPLFTEAKELYRKGRMYETGDGVEKDVDQAIYWYTKAAETGDTMFQFYLGTQYIVLKMNFEEASYWLKKADKNGLDFSEIEPETVANIAEVFYEAGYHDDAIYWYTRGAEQGIAESQYKLACKYQSGEIVPQDYQKAIYWHLKAEKQGCIESQKGLGSCYYILEDYKNAMKWLKLSAERGDALSQAILGQGYYYGLGVEEDYREAVYWLTKSAEQNDSSAADTLSSCYFEMDKPKEAIYWLTKSAELGRGDAQARLGGMYIYGLGVAQNLDKGLFWIRKGVDQENPVAKTILGSLYVDGEFVSKDPKRGFQLIKEAAEDDKYPDSSAFYILGGCYCEGLGVNRDIEKARYWLKKAVEEEVSLDELEQYFRNHPELRLSV